jgi:6-phosphogluconolactonase
MTASPILKIFADKEKLAYSLAREFSELVMRLAKEKRQVDIALSGGSTPDLFFRAMVQLKPPVDWEKVRFYWVDDRCVPPDHPESNFGTAYRAFLEPLQIPESAWFRIRGEDDPPTEAKRYSELIMNQVSPELTFPVFDLVFLGMGADGHTASIFPHQSELWNEEKLCTVGTHPETGQQRVTFTGHLINAAARVAFLVTGQGKAGVVKEVVTRTGNFAGYPAALVDPHHGELEWYLDEAAASELG